MKKSYYLLLIFIVGIALPLKAQTISKADTLHDAFLIRPLSIIKEEPRWNLATTDLYTAWLSNGLYGLYGPQPQVMLNGMPVNASFFGWQNLSMLPIFVNNIDKASSRFAPGVYHQTAAGAGLINFKTEPLQAGITAKAFYYSGNETKDPGPWAYDSLKMSPNIDRWGPDRGILLAYKGPQWFAKGFYLERFHKPRDITQNLRLHIINSRLGTNTTYVNHPIFIESKSALLKAGFHSTHWQMASRFILSDNDDYLFLQPFGKEVPARMNYRQWATQIKYHNGPWRLNARYLFDNKTLNKREQLHTYVFDWEQVNHTVSLSAGFENDVIQLTPGVIFKQLNTDAPGIRNVDDTIVTLYLKNSILLDMRYRFYLNSYLDYHRDTGTKSISVTLGTALQLSDTYTINPEIYYTESNPIRQRSFAVWLNRGYTFGERLKITSDQPLYIWENEALSLKLRNRFSFGRFSIEITPQIVKNYRLNIPWQEVKYYEFTQTLPGNFTVTQHQGKRVKLLAMAEQAISPVLHQSLTVYLQQTISGTDRYKQYFMQIPETKIKYQLDISPVSGLQLSLDAAYRSSVKWIEYAALEGEQYHLPIGIPIGEFNRTFHTTVPAFINIGLSIQKWFFDRHLSTQLGLQNILDQEVRTHTIGASLYPKFNFKVAVSF